jgi:hypothetical protein
LPITARFWVRSLELGTVGHPHKHDRSHPTGYKPRILRRVRAPRSDAADYRCLAVNSRKRPPRVRPGMPVRVEAVRVMRAGQSPTPAMIRPIEKRLPPKSGVEVDRQDDCGERLLRRSCEIRLGIEESLNVLG